MKWFPEVKTKFFLLICAFAIFSLFGQVETRQKVSNLGTIPAGPVRDQTEPDTASAVLAARRISDMINRDPWRIVNGQTNRVSRSWMQISGRVMARRNGGLVINGYCWPVGSVKPSAASTFFLANFPYAVADGDQLGKDFDIVALPNGFATYPASNGTPFTAHKMDYGMVCAAPLPRPLSPEEKAAAAQQKLDQAQRALDWHKKLAAEGDNIGLFRMGERYLKGDGVETNLLQAKIYLNRAANAGNAEAVALLEKLGP